MASKSVRVEYFDRAGAYVTGRFVDFGAYVEWLAVNVGVRVMKVAVA